jgi:tRNA(Ile)-lysidine synthase
VAAWAQQLGLAHRTLRWTGAKPRSGIQEAAREARYRLLAGLAREIGASHVVTAHTLDDQAETVIMRLIRGSGLSGLCGMAAETDLGGVTLVRPLLGIRKSQLVATCRAEGWPFIEDPSNADDRFMRVRLRRKILPLLVEEGLTPERVAILARRLARAEAALAARTDQVLSSCVIERGGEWLSLDGRRLLQEPEEIRLRVLDQALKEISGPGRPRRLERLERVEARLAEALKCGRRYRVNLAGALLAARQDGTLHISPEPIRHRGRYPDVSDDDAGAPDSLGNVGRHPYFADLGDAGEVPPPSTRRGTPDQ